MVAVPNHLEGATILDAHQWVISNLDGRNEYVLKDMNGTDVTLTDLTRGNISEVNIVPAGSRVNPAPSYIFKPEFQPQKRVQQFSSRVMLPEGLSPSVVHALEAKYGSAYRFIASKMLSQRSRRQQLSPRGTRILSSFILADPHANVRNNPIGLRETPDGIRMTRVIGDRGRIMDDAIVGEVRRYLEGNEMPFDIAATERQFSQFTVDVVQPYLICLRSNQSLIQYLNQTLLPHMLRLIDAGEFDADITEIGFIRRAFKSAVEARTTLNSAAGKDKIKKILSDQYETVVRRLATSPKDFYYGRNEALIAHPAFMYPHAAYFLLPPPQRLTGGTRAELFFYQAGEPPRYSIQGEGADTRITQEMPQRMLDNMPVNEAGEPLLPIARVNNSPVDFSNMMNTQSIGTALSQGNVGAVILSASQAFANEGVLSRMFGLGGAIPPSGLTDEENSALRDLNRIVNDIQEIGPIEYFRTQGSPDPEQFPLSAAIEVNIGGIRPKPLGWPEGLIFALMQVIAENADQIMRPHAGDNLFVPQIRGLGPERITLTAPADLDTRISNLPARTQQQIRTYFGTGITLDDLSRRGSFEITAGPSYAATIALELHTGHPPSSFTGFEFQSILPRSDSNRDQNAALRNYIENTAPDPRVETRGGQDSRMQRFNYILNEQRENNSGVQSRLGLMNILQMALTRYKESGGEPTPEQVNFVAQLATYTLTNLSTNFEAIESESLFDRLQVAVEGFSDLRQAGREEAITNLITELDARRAAIPEENVLQQMVEDRLLEMFLDDLLRGDALDDVFDNPRRNPPLPPLAEILGDGPKDTTAIRRARDVVAARNRENRTRFSTPFTPDQATVDRLANSMRDVFQQALAQVQEDREQAEQAIRRQGQITRLLGEFEDRENLRQQMNAYQQTIQDVEIALRGLISMEQDFVEAFEAVPMDPTMVLEDNLSKQEMFRHPLYVAQNLLGQHRMFMNMIGTVENSLRTTLSMVRGEAVRSGIIDIHQLNIEYLMSAIEFCNGLQEEYSNVGSSLGAAVDDMRVDDKDSISPHLYIALFDVADNFTVKEGLRIALRRSNSTSGRSVDPMVAEAAFDAIKSKSYNLVGTLFGAFPGNVPTYPENMVLDVAITYLNSLVDADLDFTGDAQDAHRRGILVAEAVSTTDTMERAAKRQLEGYYSRLAKAEARETFSGDVALAPFLTTGIEDATRRRDMLVRDSTFGSGDGGTFFRAGKMFEDIGIAQAIEAAQQRKATTRRDLFDDIAQEARQQKADYQFRTAAEGPYVDPNTMGLTEEQIEAYNQYRFEIGANRRKLKTLAIVGQISERERDMWLEGHPVHAPYGYHWRTLMAIKEGQRKSAKVRSEDAKRRAQIREVEKALRKAPEGFALDDPQRLIDDYTTLTGLAESTSELIEAGEPVDTKKLRALKDDISKRQPATSSMPARNPPVVRWSV